MLSLANAETNKKGLTWVISNTFHGATLVHCEKGGSCDPYNGDTACSQKRKLL